MAGTFRSGRTIYKVDLLLFAERPIDGTLDVPMALRGQTVGVSAQCKI
jgi:hypothetical protein